MKTVTVDANALESLLKATTGPPHLLRELIAMFNSPVFSDDDISTLIENYNSCVENYNNLENIDNEGK